MAIKTIIDAIHEQLNDSSVEYKIGRKYTAENADGHRVVWIPMSEASAPAKDVGGVKFTQAGGDERRRAIGARQVRIASHIWAKADDADGGILTAETILENLIVAARKATNIGLMFDKATWLSQTDSKAGFDDRGEVVIAEWLMRLPVWDEIKPLTTIVAAHHQGSMKFPGGTFAASVTTSENTCSS